MKRILRTFTLMSLVITGIISCKNNTNDKVLTREIKFSQEGTLSIYRSTTDSLIATLDIEIAEGEYETATGLMYRKSMQDNQGMFFIFDQEAPLSFYMKNTQFPIDIIYLDKTLNIGEIYRDAKPFDPTPLPSKRPAKFVLEVNAGRVAQWNLKPNDRVEFSRIRP